VIILADGALGQMMEKVIFPEYNPKEHKLPKPWATTGKTLDRAPNVITSLHIQSEEMEKINIRLQAKYRLIEQKEVRYELIDTDDAEYILLAFGLSSRICQRSVEIARQNGLKVGLLRPITLYPFPYNILNEMADRLKGAMVVEMNAGQMVEDVRLGVAGKIPVEFYGRMGGIIPSPEEIFNVLVKFIDKTELKNTSVEMMKEKV
ncbi:MAG: 3-methyl-2-oxobutanoate dehydrogenase subunit beta, partial [Bacteroidetes bacterium]|nr:3-methyl-2-oxobutanoate dehydrogenase subunit beta [Bacteroidota bacterium]